MSEDQARRSSKVVPNDCQAWLTDTLATAPAGNEAALQHYAGSIGMLAAALDRPSLAGFLADPRDGRTMWLAGEDDDQPALYLVSHGVGAVSLPHSHHTWAILVGVLGVERHTMYRVEHRPLRFVRPVGSRALKPHGCLILAEDAIHATEVQGAQPVLQLHLYGRPLATLPNFVERSYVEVTAAR